ncbi:MAG: NAD(P)/FAD-dependent oxidoreductase [Candidatus Omnitrophica bacterium]|nr:NAD(P)/FAD-dependent oxidoreductase [Candidatus Omnitrophota bacterium]
MGYNRKIIVVGAGPAGMMAAIRAAALGCSVIILEKKSIPGNKLLISGKGRCNLTNACDLDSFLKRFSKSGQFLRDAFKKFFNKELIDFFESRGLKLKVERQERVFPVTDRSSSILDALKDELRKNKVEIEVKSEVKEIQVKNGQVAGVVLVDGRTIFADKVILATGGVSYSFTGSDGGGLKIAKKLGHTVTDLVPGLVPLEVKQDYPRELEGLTLKNIRIIFSYGAKKIESEVGELVFTGFGISGPLVLTLSGTISEWLKAGKSVSAKIDLKPALTPEQVDNRLLREFAANPKKSIHNTLKELLPIRLIDCFLKILSIVPTKKTGEINQKERRGMALLLKGLSLDIIKTRPIEEAMVTRGGVSLKEINPRTMESRIIKGLYFAGEMIDVDADTGGFNLQAAFSTGYLAGESASAN